MSHRVYSYVCGLRFIKYFIFLKYFLCTVLAAAISQEPGIPIFYVPNFYDHLMPPLRCQYKITPYNSMLITPLVQPHGTVSCGSIHLTIFISAFTVKNTQKNHLPTYSSMSISPSLSLSISSIVSCKESHTFSNKQQQIDGMYKIGPTKRFQFLSPPKNSWVI